MNRLEINDDCATAAEVKARQKRALQFRQEQKAAVLVEQAPVAPVPPPPAPAMKAQAIAPSKPSPPSDRPSLSPTRPSARPVICATIENIKQEVCRHIGIPPGYLMLESREVPVLKYRQLVMALALRANEHPADVALAFQCDRTTVLNAQRQMNAVLDALDLNEQATLTEWVAAALPLVFVEIAEIRTMHRSRFKDQLARKAGRYVRRRQGALAP